MFDEMIDSIRSSTVRSLLTVMPRQPMQRQQVMTAANAQIGGSTEKIKKSPIRKKEKIGPNDPCPCGSGKKYKRCCMGNEEN
ncbi:MAG: SEC-C domain-containing protein [Clostridia bacterium]|nr:SEC-C domain-containing protein [Clostridia bacterium]